MIRVTLAPSILKHAQADSIAVDASSVAEALSSVFAAYPKLRSYVLDDQGGVRRHVTIFVNNQTIHDRQTLKDKLSDNDEVYVFQALSGG